MLILVKNCWTLSALWAGALVNHSSRNGQMHWDFKKNSLKPNVASHSYTTWHTDIDGFLELSPSGGDLYYNVPALQKMILVFGVPSSTYKTLRKYLPRNCSVTLEIVINIVNILQKLGGKSHNSKFVIMCVFICNYTTKQ